jgi:SLT domain-containing protein
VQSFRAFFELVLQRPGATDFCLRNQHHIRAYLHGFADTNGLLDDLRAIKLVDGVARLPKSTGQKNRHGDAAIALALAYYATRQNGVEIEFRSTGIKRSGYEAGRVQQDVGWGAVGGATDTGGF